MNTKELIEKLLKQKTKDFGKWRCKELNLDCPACKAYQVEIGLKWWLDLVKFGEKFDKK